MKAQELAKQIKFDFGEEVEYAIKSGKDRGIVCEITIAPGHILYLVIWSDKISRSHYEFELKKVEAK